ncbi:MAG: succinylglutamate desuccinylase/aspartoacylase family protein [Flavobacteriales bacterium]|nr:succinylglutamate desuccinylase/aspartoacylase family protein [Flavobacteriales bacterium]
MERDVPFDQGDSCALVRILGESVRPGEQLTLDLQVARLYTRTSVNIPVVVHRSMADGPVLLLLAGVHGDEVNGIDTVRRILNDVGTRPIEKGTLVAIPVFNVFGFLNMKRQLPDGRDLNRYFPGSPKGSLASRLAHALAKDVLPAVDLTIDLHSGSAQRYNLPHIRFTEDDERSLELARVFDAPLIVQAPVRPRSIREMLHQQGRSYLLFEGGKAQSLDHDAIRVAHRGITRIMEHLGLWSGTSDLTQGTSMITGSRWVRAGHSGLFHPMMENGSKVSQGMILGLITDPYGEMAKQVKAPFDGTLFCVNTAPVVNQGDALFHLGY